MNLLSFLEYEGFEYYVLLRDNKSAQSWYVFSVIHPDDYVKTGDDRYGRALRPAMIKGAKSKDYLVEALSKSKNNGKSKSYGRLHIINSVLKAYVDCRDFNYPKSAILTNTNEYVPERVRVFEADTQNISIKYRSVDNVLEYLTFSNNVYSLDFREVAGVTVPKSLEWNELVYQTDAITSSTMHQPNFEELNCMMDLSWYWDEKTGERVKDYTIIDSNELIESKFITPFIHFLNDCVKKGEKPLVFCDTETSGLGIMDISENNPLRDEITTIQFSWLDDQGVIIYFDMEEFDNASLDYFISRVGHVFKYYTSPKESFSIKLIRDENGNEINEVYHFNYGCFDLGAHNAIFDSKVTLQSGRQFYFTEDTLQMAFNLDPEGYKRSKSLKSLTRYFMNWETPELTDILGKGNEGCFRLLKDREITKIYGCADVDTGRYIWKELRALMPDKMYNSYKALDPITWYVCAQSEYRGLKLEGKLLHENLVNITKDLDNLRDLIYIYVGNMLASKVSKMMEGSDKDYSDESMELSKNLRYEFKLQGEEVKNVVYNLLNYPVLGYSKKTGAAALNSDVIKKLLYKKLPKSSNILKEDLISSDGSEVLVDKEKFNHYKYPLCYLLKQYGTLNKEYTTYYRPFEEEDTEGRLFKRISTTNIATRRISCPAQTIKKNLKAAIIPYNEDYYCANFDLNQVEARIFTSEANDSLGIGHLDNPENDYHIENGAQMYNLPPYKVTDEIRKQCKTLGFGIPYGLQDPKMCERIFTIINETNLIETRKLRALFEKAKKPEMDYLNGIRAKAIEPVDVPVELKRFWGLKDDSKVGLVKNANGFWRYFCLDDVIGNRRLEASVGRQAGNFPIQSFAADLFRFLIKRLYNELVKRGYEKLVHFDMYIHDEIQMSVHKSIDPRELCDIIQKSCVVRLKGHTVYYVGLNFGDSWYDCKKGKYEMPPILLKRISNAYSNGEYELSKWTDEPNDIIGPMVMNYKVDRSFEILHKIYPNLNGCVISVEQLINSFTNYTVRGYINSQKALYEFDKKDSNESFINGLCFVLKDHGYGGTLIEVDGEVRSVDEYVDYRNSLTVKKSSSFTNDVDEEIELDLDDDLEELMDAESNFFSFDSMESFVDWAYDDKTKTFFYGDDDEEETSIFEKEGIEFKYVKPMGSKYVITLRYARDLNSVIKFLNRYQVGNSDGGLGVFIETPIASRVVRGKFKINLEEFDKVLVKLNEPKKGVVV